MSRFSPIAWLAGAFIWALCAGATLLAAALVLYWFRPCPERLEDEWEGFDDECEHMRGDTPGSCARCEGT